MKFENTLTNFVNTIRRYRSRVCLSEVFKKIKMNYLIQAEIDKVKQKSLKKVNEIQSELVGVIKKYDLTIARDSELESEMQSTKKKLQDSQRYIKELEERSVQLNNEYIHLLE